MTDAQSKAMTEPVELFHWDNKKYDLACYYSIESQGYDVIIHSRTSGSQTLKGYPDKDLLQKVQAAAPHLERVYWQQ